MLVTPGPIGLTLFFLPPGKIPMLVMVLFFPHAMCAIFTIVPFVIVIVSAVVVSFVFFGTQRGWHRRQGSQKQAP